MIAAVGLPAPLPAWEEIAVLDPREAAAYSVQPHLVRHTFTRFHLELTIARATPTTGRLAERAMPGAVWCPIDQLTERALRKVIAHAVKS